ncbi:MAG: 3-oxoacyl-[acyl-carrier-protein] reductase [Elusimicrobiaceae bacterium]|nr:3-oxoacyl-[acyl-carrier-protein] reductase [Elusimicrobiaceae bacterium]
MKLFEGKISAVTGGSRGIGFAIAEKLAEQGSGIALCATGLERAEAAAADLAQRFGVKTLGLQADVARAADCEAFAANTIAGLGVPDILVNNAGITRDTLTMRMSESDWDAVLDTNLKGAFLITKAFSKAMLKKRGGRIINISSVVGQTGNAGQPNYSAAKGGLIALTKAHAREFASRGICVNSVAPGFVETDMTAQFAEELRTRILESIPLGRAATSRDIAQAVLFLAGEGGSYITGQVINVNGGMFM